MLAEFLREPRIADLTMEVALRDEIPTYAMFSTLIRVNLTWPNRFRFCFCGLVHISADIRALLGERLFENSASVRELGSAHCFARSAGEMDTIQTYGKSEAKQANSIGGATWLAKWKRYPTVQRISLK